MFKSASLAAEPSITEEINPSGLPTLPVPRSCGKNSPQRFALLYPPKAAEDKSLFEKLKLWLKRRNFHVFAASSSKAEVPLVERGFLKALPREVTYTATAFAPNLDKMHRLDENWLRINQDLLCQFTQAGISLVVPISSTGLLCRSLRSELPKDCVGILSFADPKLAQVIRELTPSQILDIETKTDLDVIIGHHKFVVVASDHKTRLITQHRIVEHRSKALARSLVVLAANEISWRQCDPSPWAETGYGKILAAVPGRDDNLARIHFFKKNRLIQQGYCDGKALVAALRPPPAPRPQGGGKVIRFGSPPMAAA